MELIDKYKPSDYCDSVSRRMKRTEPLSPDHIFEEMFCNFPKPVVWLFKLRNALVKPFGLQGGGGFRNLISERNDEEIILSKNDKHLSFWIGIYCSLPEDDWKKLASPSKEKHFLEGQLPLLCQSCGMPMTSDDMCGTNADGSTSFDYCKYFP